MCKRVERPLCSSLLATAAVAAEFPFSANERPKQSKYKWMQLCARKPLSKPRVEMSATHVQLREGVKQNAFECPSRQTLIKNLFMLPAFHYGTFT